ncbi:hypothetical protein ABC347_07665 [Sphingomonas sp. 1P06PA]|uniref:hypothetical protein n=1 Tax=Sphingomonas sp. 1P06PA TaxID=554121 RepID=UPI0039A4B8AC
MPGDLVERLNGAPEWGYRCVAEGTFISDDAPFTAADHIAALQARVERLEGALTYVGECFDAAVSEGLYERIAEASDSEEPGSLAGLFARRINHGYEAVRAALAEPTEGVRE